MPGVRARSWSVLCSAFTPIMSTCINSTPWPRWKTWTRSWRRAEPPRHFWPRARKARCIISVFPLITHALELDRVLFPVNVNAWENGGFGPQILAKAKSKGMARMALKALAFGKWPAGMKESDRKYPKCWYQPIDDREMARL